MNGWISLHRKIFDHPFYKERRVFSHYEAWIDLLLLANHEDHEFLFGNDVVQARRGEVITSEVNLMERWRWSKAKVRWFLNRLEKDRSTDRTTYPRKTKLFIKNYDSYQNSQTSNKPINIPDYIPEKDTINKGNKEISLNKKRKIRGNTSPLPSTSEFKMLMECWNGICSPLLPQVMDIPPRRKSTIKARLRERPDLEEWKGIFQRVIANPFLRGENDKGWRADFDWVINPNNLAKIVEGKYDDRTNVNKPKTGMAALKASMEKSLEGDEHGK